MILKPYISIGEVELGVVAEQDLERLILECFEESFHMGSHFWEAVHHYQVGRCHKQPKYSQDIKGFEICPKKLSNCLNVSIF